MIKKISPGLFLFFFCFVARPILAQTIVKLDSSSNVQGITFDAPVKLQLNLNKNAHVFNVSIYDVPKKTYHERLNAIATGQGPMAKDVNYYSEVLSTSSSQSIPLTKNDVLMPIGAGSTPTYQMTLVNPVYFKPNKHYVVGLLTSLMDDNTYGPLMAAVMEKLLQAHQALVAAGPALAAGQLAAPAEDPVFDADPDATFSQTTQNAWEALKLAYAAVPAADQLLQEGITLYADLEDKVYTENRYSGLPAKDNIVDSNIVNFYWVYASLEPLLGSYSSYVQISQTNLPFPSFAGDTCLYRLLQHQLICANCDKVFLEGGFLKDTSGFHAFVNDLLQPQSQTAAFISTLTDSIAHGLLLTPAKSDDDKQLRLIRNQLTLLQTMASFRTLRAAGCDSALLQTITTAAATVDALIQSRKQLAKIQAKFMELLAGNEKFLTIRFYNADTYVYDLNTRYGFRLTADLGIVNYGFIPNYAYNLGQVTPYAGVNFNFQYVQSNIPFSSIPGNRWYSARHWSVMLGMSLLSVKQGSKFTNLFGSHGLLLGVGYRIIQEVRLVGGAMLVKKLNPDPLIGSTTTAAIPFFGLSFDTNTILQGIIKYF